MLQETIASFALNNGCFVSLFLINKDNISELLKTTTSMRKRGQLLSLFQDVQPQDYTQLISGIQASIGLVDELEYFEFEDAVDALLKTPANMRASVAKEAIPLMEMLHIKSPATAFQALMMISPSERASVMALASRFIQKDETKSDIACIVQMVLSVDKNERACVVGHAHDILSKMPIENDLRSFARLQNDNFVLRAVSMTHPDKRVTVAQQALFFIQNNMNRIAMAKIIMALNKGAADDIASVTHWAHFIMQNNPSCDPLSALKKVHQISQEKREAILTHAYPLLFLSMADIGDRKYLIQILESLPSDDFESVVASVLSVSPSISGFNAAYALREMRDIPAKDRLKVVEHAKNIYKSTYAPHNEIKHLMMAIASHKNEHDSSFTETASSSSASSN